MEDLSLSVRNSSLQRAWKRLGDLLRTCRREDGTMSASASTFAAIQKEFAAVGDVLSKESGN
jgi:hypothetical protein